MTLAEITKEIKEAGCLDESEKSSVLRVLDMAYSEGLESDAEKVGELIVAFINRQP